MKSIRLSLIVYFLVLLAAALGAVSYFFYQGMSAALQAEEVSTRELLTTRHKNNIQAIKANLDKQLLSQAPAPGRSGVRLPSWLGAHLPGRSGRRGRHAGHAAVGAPVGAAGRHPYVSAAGYGQTVSESDSTTPTTPSLRPPGIGG